MSPCSITKEDLSNAPIYGSDRQEQKFLFKNITVPPELESERIVVLNPGLGHKAVDTPDMRTIAYTAIEELLGEWKKKKQMFRQGASI